MEAILKTTHILNARVLFKKKWMCDVHAIGVSWGKEVWWWVNGMGGDRLGKRDTCVHMMARALENSI